MEDFHASALRRHDAFVHGRRLGAYDAGLTPDFAVTIPGRLLSS
jgi:hypothetical protein